MDSLVIKMAVATRSDFLQGPLRLRTEAERSDHSRAHSNRSDVLVALGTLMGTMARSFSYNRYCLIVVFPDLSERLSVMRTLWPDVVYLQPSLTIGKRSWYLPQLT